MKNENRQNFYLDVYNDLLQKGCDSEVACSILNQIGKDARVEKMTRSERRWDNSAGGQTDSSPDSPATEKQLNFLRRLGVPFSDEVTKKEASELIDKAHNK